MGKNLLFFTSLFFPFHVQPYNQSCFVSHQDRLKIVAFISGFKFIITRVSVVILYMTLVVHSLNVTVEQYPLREQQATVYYGSLGERHM
jgi:hypothetical protein